MPKETTKYKREYNRQAEKLCLLGATDKNLADFFDVCEATINNWKIQHPSFKKSLDKGKRIANANVAESLYKRATGAKIKATKIMQYKGEVIKQDYVEEFPPDTRACQYWLNNREPEMWRNQPEAPDGDDDAPPEKVLLEIVDARVRDS